MAVLALTVITTGTLVVAAGPQTAAPAGGPSRLVSVQHFPLPDGDMCALVPVDRFAAEVPLGSETADALPKDQVVTSPLTQAILTFRGGAAGEEAPIRIIQGPKTGIQGVGATGKVAIDPDNNVIMLATPAPRNEILFFARDASGDVAPLRKIGGPDTLLDNGTQRDGGGNVPAMRVDPIHNLLLIPTNGRGGGGGGRVLVFDRNASGNVKPKAVIVGPVRAGNQFEVYAPNRLMITHSGKALDLWKIPDSGESTAQPQRIPAPLGRASADTGIALDPAHKEVIIATAAGNTIMTFSVPEVFDPAVSTR